MVPPTPGWPRGPQKPVGWWLWRWEVRGSSGSQGSLCPRPLPAPGSGRDPGCLWTCGHITPALLCVTRHAVCAGLSMSFPHEGHRNGALRATDQPLISPDPASKDPVSRRATFWGLLNAWVWGRTAHSPLGPHTAVTEPPKSQGRGPAAGPPFRRPCVASLPSAWPLPG